MVSVPIRSRDKLAIGLALGALSLAAWVVTLHQPHAAHAPAAAPSVAAHHGLHPAAAAAFPLLPLLVYLSTWLVMTAAMMLPAAVPTVATYAAVVRQRPAAAPVARSVALFVLGYVLAWGVVGALAYKVSAWMPVAVLVVPALQGRTALLGGAALILIGAYQFSPLKARCLALCRTPLGFILAHWRGGVGGALRMGLHHGLYCIGCCWALMVVMLVAGSLSVAGMALLALVMYAEKVSRHGLLVVKTVGVALILIGTARVALSGL